MRSLKLPDRDSLGWLIPILLFCIFYGGFLWFDHAGSLRWLGLLFFITGVLGLSKSRRVRRLIGYHALPKTPERREAFESANTMDRWRRQAKKERVPELVTALYFDFVRHFPAWFNSAQDDENARVVPTTVTGAKKLAGNRITMTMNGREYIFTFVQYAYSTPEGERDIQATLQVSLANRKLILIHLVPDPSDTSRFQSVSIEYVVMTDWINEFKHLRELIDDERQRRYHEDRLN